jgi:hypothetical protein
MSGSRGSGRLIEFLFGSPIRVIATIVVGIALGFAFYGYAVIRGHSLGAVSPGRGPVSEDRGGDSGDKEYTVGAAHVPVHPMGLFSGHTAPRKAFPLKEVEKRDEEIPAWWESPPPLTPREIGFQRYLAALTYRLPKRDWGRFWNVGGNQTGLQTIRFYAAFTGYAAVALGMRTPAYTGETSRIVLSAIDHLLDRRAWSYVSLLWKDDPWYPDPAAHENIMYTGHVLQLMAFYEAMTGDRRFRTEGFDFVWDEDTRFHYDVKRLIEVTVGQMRDNPSGGVACEPRHIFFTCNTHPHVALTVYAALGLGDWSAERAKWEQFALDSFYDDLGGGAIRCVYHQDKKLFFPVGYPGMDGWSLMWYSTWARDPGLPEAIWKLAKKAVKEDLFKKRRPVKREQLQIEGTHNLVSYLFSIVQATLPPIPTAAFLYPAATACGDPESASKLRTMLEKRFLSQRDGMAFLKIPHRFNIGSNANMALGLALENGSNMRHLVQRPLPRDYFDGPLVSGVSPPEVAVTQAYRDGEELVVELLGRGAVELTLENVSQVSRVGGLDPGSWRFADGVLHVELGGSGLLRIATGG